MKIHKNKIMEKAVDYISKKIGILQQIPSVLADRALKTCALSFLFLFFGGYMGGQMGSTQFICASVAISIYGFVQGYRVLRIAEKKDYETIEGTVYEIKGKYVPGKVYRVGIRLEGGDATQLLLDKRHKFQIGKKYRFYFSTRQQALTGIKNIDVVLNVDSFYGYEEIE